MPNHRKAEAQQTSLRLRPCGIIPVSALWVLCRYRHKTHATGHASRLERDGIVNPVRFGSERYSKEELVAELGASFLSNEAGILDQVRFDNSAAYLHSWTQKLTDDPSLIVSAASQAQKGADWVKGIRHSQQESLHADQAMAAGLSPVFHMDYVNPVAAQAASRSRW